MKASERRAFKFGDKEGRQGDANRACIQAGECRPRAHAKKSTRHWCRGKVGVAHDWRWVNQEDLPNYCTSARGRRLADLTQVSVCTKCGKQDYPWRHVHLTCGNVCVESRHVVVAPARYATLERRCPRCGWFDPQVVVQESTWGKPFHRT